MTDLLVENDNDIELNIEGASVSMNAKWGDITGDIDNQTDLKNALDGKADDDEVVKIDGDQDIFGKKTFNEPVHLVNDDGTIPLLVIHNGVDDKTGLSQFGFTLDYETENEKTLAFPTLEEDDTIATASQVSSKANADFGILTNADISASHLEIDNTEDPSIRVNDVNYYFDGTSGTLENQNNKVVSLSSQSTDTQYPSAKCVYDIVGNIESLLEAI